MASMLMTVPEAAEYLNLATSKVYELVHSKDFPAVKIGKNWRIMRDKLDKWLLEKWADKD